MLETYLKDRRKEKDILLMTHIVAGYPFSEPIADGPVILKANQDALERGVTVSRCLEFGREVARRHDIPFLYMTYYNILFRHGVDAFVEEMAADGIQGAIVPDLPPEEGEAYLQAMAQHGRHPIFIFSPTTSDERLRYLSSFAQGFVYCVARKGVTGMDTRFTEELSAYLTRCRQATDLPLALGFGVKDKEDVDYLKGKADIAVIGTQTLRLVDTQGVAAVGDFIRGLR